MSRRTYPKEVKRKCWECGEQSTFIFVRFPIRFPMYLCSKCDWFIDVHSFARMEAEETRQAEKLGKQVAKKVIVRDIGVAIYDCPNCKQTFLACGGKDKHCRECGQVLDWSEVE